MEPNADKIKQLEEQLTNLMARQDAMGKDLQSVRRQLSDLKGETAASAAPIIKEQSELIVEKKAVPIVTTDYKPQHKKEPIIDASIKAAFQKEATNTKPEIGQPSALEKFIGENLISKIGVIILVIGVAIGAKYAIENELISPLTRIVLGYFVGAGLLATAIYLKPKYENFSAVILSGSIAIFYIITYLAYSLYGLFPQVMAFIMLIIFTVFAVIAAIHYNKQVIAVFGLVGAYAIPFLLSTGSGRVDILFSFMTIVNIGILAVSISKYWKALNYTSFTFTWLMMIVWLLFKYDQPYFSLALLFSTIFYVIFYGTFIINKLKNAEKFTVYDVLLIILNSFIYYFIGYSLLLEHSIGQHYIGLFTVAIALINFGVSYLFYKRKSADKNLLLFTIGLVLVFVTIAIPVQFDGFVVTILWAGIATVLFWLARTKELKSYEWLSYPIMLIAFVSLTNDWQSAYTGWSENGFQPLLNTGFLSTILFAVAFAIMTYFLHAQKYQPAVKSTNVFSAILANAIPSILVFSIFNVGQLELNSYFENAFQQTQIMSADGNINAYNYNLLDLKGMWLTIYCLIFALLFHFVVKKWINRPVLRYVSVAGLVVGIFFFLTSGLYLASELRENYLQRSENLYYQISGFNIGIRYVGMAFTVLALFILNKLVKAEFKTPFTTVIRMLFTHLTILWLLSSELIHLISMSNAAIAYKLSLSILWGFYSLFLVSIGIWKEQSILRFAGMALFGITLLKLFFYDIAHLSTISKTIVFVLLGILLLIVSFLYNKYKHKISPDD